ncbi:hypothetical protein [Thermogladius sp.]|uniref:hypothetical protein n=1 Tax=Thermogladius sp. TaxID=2023064 RepID=UPI003D0FBD56
MLRGLARDYAFSLMLVAGLMVRLVFVPYTSGSDIAQFASFSDTFLRHGLEFYKYADAKLYAEEGWPYNWPYVYGPQLVLLLAPLRALLRQPVLAYWNSGNYYVYVPVEWVVACKSLFVAFDVVSGALIYLILSRYSGGRAALVGFALYYLNPAVIYTSSVYGMFDQIPLSLILASLYLYRSGRRLPSLALAGLAATFKPNVAPASLGVLVSSLVEDKCLKSRLSGLAAFVLGALSPFAPFAAYYSQTLSKAFEVLASLKPGYTYPIVYSFNGLSSLATYMHQFSGGDYEWVVSYWWVFYLVLNVLVAIWLTSTRERDAGLLALLLYLAFTTSYWRVNYQYFVPGIGLAALQVGGSRRRTVASIVYIAYIAFWVFMFPTSWWAHVHIKEPNMELWRVMDMFSLMVFDEGVYVVYSVLLTVLSVAVITALVL